MFSPGDIIANRYQIIAPLAEGGMGAVYRAKRTLLGDEVAIKIVRPDLTNPGARERFLRESRVAASLRHPAVVTILDFDMPSDTSPYLVMELLSGPSLREEIQERGRLDVEDVQRILPSICSALHLAHAGGIVHRDIKPANIVAHDYQDGRVYKLVDFGVANLRQQADETRLTGSHQFVGTVTYASPEQMTGSNVDARSDVYSLAAVAFEMLTGRPPFEGPDATAVVTAHLTQPAPRVRSVRPEVPGWLDDAIAKGLAKTADDRWASAAEFGAALSVRLQPEATSRSFRLQAEGLSATYELGELIGPGRLGSQVFRAVHRALGHPVAIRILPSSAPNWAGARERFLREAKSLQVAHPSVIQVRDFGEEPDFVYLVTDFIDGPSVRDALKTHGRIDWPRLQPLLGQLLEAARVLHRRNTLLCGLSPEIMRLANDPDVDGGARLMISTGGIWRAQDLLATMHESTVRGLSIQDVELRYVAPELLTGGAVDIRSDVFTIGVLAYELATGRPPFDGATMPELLGRMLTSAPQPPRELAPELPEAVASALLRALRAAPAERFADTRELRAAVI